MFIYCLEVKKIMSKIIQFWFAAVLFIVSGVSADFLSEENINDGSIEMYSQVTHTGNVVSLMNLRKFFIRVVQETQVVVLSLIHLLDSV